MLSEECLPDPKILRVEAVKFNAEQTTIILTLHCTMDSANCPTCQQSSSKVHSHYMRTLADLPCFGWQTRLHLRVRRFFCPNQNCKQSIFSERLDTITNPWSRRTARLEQVQRQVGWALGGIASERLAQILQLPLSLDTFLRLIRDSPPIVAQTPRVLGVDDWAMRKGHHYGTLLVNLETHTPVDLLPDRTAQTFQKWLEQHSGIEIICRDRAGAYAEGARLGAPKAIQVADRWHILKNLGDALVKILEKHRRQLKQVPILPLPNEPLTAIITIDMIERQSALSPSKQIQHDLRRQERYERYKATRQLFSWGWSLSAVAAYLGLDRKTVRKYAHADTFPEQRLRSHQTSLLDPYKTYLLQRWNAGCRNGAQLLCEIRDQGYSGGNSIVRQFVAQIRKALQLPPKSRMVEPVQLLNDTIDRPLTPRHAAWLVLQVPDQMTNENQTQINQMRTFDQDIDTAISLTQEFAEMVRTKAVRSLDNWLDRAASSGLTSLRSFVNGIRRDYDAVRAGIESEWSSGQVEGQVNRLKFIKRQMYGRAKFDLLRQRVLYED
ncbi:ISL3 family transposase [bacterium]|nr:ISL3 family transposase [bacterium]